MKTQYVTVHIEYKDKSAVKELLRGAVMVYPRQIESLNVYGPFPTKRAAMKDAAEMQGMGGVILVRAITAPPESETNDDTP